MLNAVISRAAGGFDRAVNQAIAFRTRGAHARSRIGTLGFAQRMAALEAIEADYNRPEYFADAEAFFGPATPPSVVETRVRSLGRGGRVVDVRWPSACAPIDARVTARYVACEANRRAAARVLLHGDAPRPAVILVHGYLGGYFAFEERVWPLASLRARGFDVALAVLPFHGVRRDPTRSVPLFPGADPRITIEGFRQAVGDLRALSSWLRGRGAPSVGVMGMSLGGYTTALFATLERDLAFAVPVIPLASIADIARDGGRLTGTPAERAAQHAALDRAMRVVSPLARPSLVPRERTMVLAAAGDAITPLSHARALADHFDAPLEVFAGGHLLQIGRGRAFDAVGRMLDRAGFPLR